MTEYASGEPNSSEVNMVRTFADCVLEKQLDARYSELTLKTQKILDACRRSDVANGAKIEL